MPRAKHLLTRETIAAGTVEQVLIDAERRGLVKRLPPGVRQRLMRATLARLPRDRDPWLFGYGSLMWNPAFHFAESRTARIWGHHRRFCLWTPIGRGSPDRPGLTLALDRGGSCTGIAFRVPWSKAEEEFGIVFKRELVTGAYRPTIVRARTDRGPVQAVAFVVNRDHPRYGGLVPEPETVTAIAGAKGWLGRCSDYLFDTVAHLDELGIVAGPMHRLARRVRTEQCATASTEQEA